MLTENRIRIEMPERLQEVFDGLDYEEDGWMVKRNLAFSDDTLTFDFLIRFGDELETMQLWQMVVAGYKTSRFLPDKMSPYFDFYDDHFLLWQYQYNVVELHLKKKAANPEALLADLYTAHQCAFGNYLPFGTYLNNAHDVLALCNLGFGLFGSGPKNILDIYYACLQRAGTEPYFFGPPDADKTNTDLKLAILGECYFIGNNFHFKKLENKSAQTH